MPHRPEQEPVMRFTIITTKPGPQPPQMICDFYPPGGTIGRGSNTLELPDESRMISRLQALVHTSASGECSISERGRVTHFVLNNIPLGEEQQAELRAGDELRIGEYVILVSELGQQPVAAKPTPVTRPAAPVQPVAPVVEEEDKPAPIPAEIWDTLVDEFSISDNLSSSRQPKPQALPEPAVTAAKTPEFVNPFAQPVASDRNPEDPLAQIVASDEMTKQLHRSTDPTQLFAEDSLFEGESIFADATPSALTRPTGEQKVTPVVSEAKTEEDPLALFGAELQQVPTALSSDDPLGILAQGAKPLSTIAPAAAPETVEETSENPAPSTVVLSKTPNQNDPLNLFGTETAEEGNVATPVAHTEEESLLSLLSSDKAEETPDPLLAALAEAEKHLPPHAREAKPQAEPVSPAEKEAESELADLASSPLFAELPSSQPVSEAPRNDYAGITLPTPQTVTRTVTPPPKGRLRIDPVDYGAARAEQNTAPQTNDSRLNGELLDALIEGMGLKDLQPVPQFDKAQMHQLGQMLGMFSQGTVALLSSRSILKRGVKAEMTVILDEANNPFKLLPSGKSVLMQMYGSRMPGFMAPNQSVRDALVDLQAHQLGMIAGIRAIIAAMLQSFNPEQLEAEAKEEGLTSRIGFASSRKAALWEHFTQRYKATAGEIEDDFHTLFGEAFLHAYDMEVNQYKDSQNASDT